MKLNKSLILKITGFITIPLLVMVVAMFFLYPYINKEEYQNIVEDQKAQLEQMVKQDVPPLAENTVSDSLFSVTDSLVVSPDSIQVEDTLSVDEIKYLQVENKDLHAQVDSLMATIELLRSDLNSRNNDDKSTNLSPEEFSDRIKSLLNLEEDDLAPILEKMSKEQLVRLYNGGRSTQREKILRSLKSEKAAELMTEIML